MEKVLIKSVEGGYTIKDIILKDGEMFAFAKLHPEDVYNKALLDPKFWQCLGKALGWFYPDGRSVAKYINNDPKRTQKDMWIWHWHQFIDHLANGGIPDEFFEKLLA